MQEKTISERVEILERERNASEAVKKIPMAEPDLELPSCNETRDSTTIETREPQINAYGRDTLQFDVTEVESSIPSIELPTPIA